MTVTRPTSYANWAPDGAASKVTQPPTALRASGWSVGQPMPAVYANWLFYIGDQWIQWLDQASYSTSAAASIDSDIRLLGGGNWSYSVSSGTLAWDAAFSLSIPGSTDAQNTAAAGSVTLASGQVAYVLANIPITAHGDITAGSTTVANVDYPAGITVGMSVSGTGIPSTTVTAINGNTFTLASTATANTVQQALVFSSSGALTVSVANIQNVVPGPTLVIIARATATQAVIGVNAGQMALRDGELKQLLDNGYISQFTAVAGATLPARTPVYIAPAGDTGRTAGQAYPLDTSAANAPMRAAFIGFSTVGGANGLNVSILSDGVLTGFTGLSAGSLYYSDNATPGGMTSIKPTATNAYVVPLGMAVSATALHLNPAQAASTSNINAVVGWPNYIANSESQLATSIASANAAGGGVIVIGGPFVLSASYTVSSNTLLQGRSGGSILTINAGGSLTLSGNSKMRDVMMTTALTFVSLLSVTGNGCVIRDCTYTIPSASSGTCISVSGNSNRFYNNAFYGVASASATATGINYTGGSNNLDDSSIFYI